MDNNEIENDNYYFEYLLYSHADNLYSCFKVDEDCEVKNEY